MLYEVIGTIAGLQASTLCELNYTTPLLQLDAEPAKGSHIFIQILQNTCTS